MLLPKTNIEQKLSSIKKKRILAEDIDLKQVYSILSNLDNELDRIENNVIIGKVKEKGFTLVPLSIYFNAKGIAKVEIGLATGKKQHDGG